MTLSERYNRIRAGKMTIAEYKAGKLCDGQLTQEQRKKKLDAENIEPRTKNNNKGL